MIDAIAGMRHLEEAVVRRRDQLAMFMPQVVDRKTTMAIVDSTCTRGTAHNALLRAICAVIVEELCQVQYEEEQRL